MPWLKFLGNSVHSQLMESESVDEGICAGTEGLQANASSNAAIANQNFSPVSDAPPLEQETLMEVGNFFCFFFLLYTLTLLSVIDVHKNGLFTRTCTKMVITQKTLRTISEDNFRLMVTIRYRQF